MSGCEKRKYKRLAVKFDLSCRKVGSSAKKVHTGCTVNVSPGGLYFETTAEAFKPDDLLRMDLSIPPRAGQLEFGGRISGFGKVLRTCDAGTNSNLAGDRYGVALEFCQSPKLST